MKNNINYNKIEPEFVLNEVYGIWYTPFYKTYLGIFIISLIIIIFLILLFFTLKKIIPIIFRKTPFKEALYQLNKLKIDNTIFIKQKEFYEKITTILKNYIIKVFNIENKGITDSELINFIKIKSNIEDIMVIDIEKLLERANLAKFANKNFQEFIINDINLVINFIKYIHNNIEKRKNKS